MTLAEFIGFVIVAAVLLSFVPKGQSKPYTAGMALFYLLWAVVIEEFNGMVFAIYVMQGLLLLQHLATLYPSAVRVFAVAIAFMPGLLFINLVLYLIHRQLKTRRVAREALEPDEDPILEEVC